MDQKGEIIMNEVAPDLDALALEWDRKVVEIAGPEQTQMEAAFKNLVEDVERNMGGDTKEPQELLARLEIKFYHKLFLWLQTVLWMKKLIV